jgi:hypothetical protein
MTWNRNGQGPLDKNNSRARIPQGSPTRKSGLRHGIITLNENRKMAQGNSARAISLFKDFGTAQP